MSDNKFKLQINLTKAYVGDDGGHYLEGIASGPEVDLTGERMSVEALQSMVNSLQKRLIEFRDAHRNEWNDDLGEVVALHLDESNRLHYKAKLDLRLSKAQDLWYLMTEKGKKYGVSIGGSVVKAAKEYVAELGREVFTYFDVDLYEISVTRQAAYQHSFANAVLKSLPKGHTMSDETKQVEKTEEVPAEEVVETPEVQDTPEEANQEDVAAEEQSDATPDQPQAEGEEVEQSNDEEAAADDVDAESNEAVETEVQPQEEANSDEQPEAEAPAEAEEEAQEEAETQEEQAEVAKDLTEAEDKTETLQKSLDQATVEVEELKKSLLTRVEEIEKAQSELAEVKKALEEKDLELQKRDARKAIVFDKFVNTTDQVEKSNDEIEEGNKLFANFVITGAK